MILTDTIGTGHMVLTPTYYVFKMYRGFQDATYLPMDVTTDSINVEGGHMFKMVNGKIPDVSVSAARKKDGSFIISLANTSLDKAQTTKIILDDTKIKTVNGDILTSDKINDYNDFNHPDKVIEKVFKDAKIKKNVLNIKIPAKSIIVLNLNS